MADYIVKDTELTGVANSIRTAGSTSSLLTFPNGFISAINNISGGGGGDSDFSTAEVTIEQGMPPKMTMPLPICNEAEMSFASVEQIEASGTVTAVLYKGTLVAAPNLEEGANVSVSGNCEYNSEWQQFLITGDCTITIS